jgi:Glycosyltransferase family 87
VGRRTCEVGERRYRRAYKHRLDKYRNGGIVVTALPRGRGIHRIEFFAITSLIIQLSVLAWCAGQLSPHEAKAPMVGWDFVVFWSAARVALEHGAAMVFSPELLRAMEASVTNWVDVAPWPYPPTFLLAVIPIGWLSFLTALAVFSAVGFTLYALMLARIGRGLDRIHFLFAAAFPGVGVALAAGQNSLITVAAAGGALALLRSNAMLAGACIAALAIKPQFAVLFPLALLCGRQWKAFAAAAVCALSFVAVATFVLGRQAWITFATHLPVFNYLFVENGVHHWAGMPTVFAAARVAGGGSITAAYAAQALVAIPTVAATAYLWLKDARFELRASALIISTLLVQPYFMYYDLAWLAIPIVFLMRDAKVAKLSRLEWVLIGAAWLLPVEVFFVVTFEFPLRRANKLDLFVRVRFPT